MKPIRFAPFVFALISYGSGSVSGQNDLSFEPYTVYVVEEQSHARCGPSEDYYRTDPLRHGQALEVYAETDDGWLGIRPPVDSFCWVQAKTIDLDRASNVGVVVEDRTVAWIGTHLGRARSYRWQVQLAEGEEVTVIGKSEREGADGPQLWYRIVPPSGEYRWVHRSQIVDSSEKLVEATRRASRQTTLGDRYVDDVEDRSDQTDNPNTDTTKDDNASETPSQRRGNRRKTPALATADDGASVLKPAPTATANEQPSEVPPSEPWESNDERLAVDNPVSDEDHDQPDPTDDQFKVASSAEVEFIGRPKLLEIGSRPKAPARDDTAGDGNWVTGTSPRLAGATNGHAADHSASPIGSGVAPVAAATLSNPVAQVSGETPLAPQSLTADSAPADAPKIVSAQRIAQIEAETNHADIERLDLIFSRLMAAQATAVEVEPITRAAQRWMNATTDPASSGRARMLVERTEQYRRVAQQRYGRAVIDQSASLETFSRGGSLNHVGMSNGIAFQGAPVAPNTTAPSNDPQRASVTGTLVQVYSARSSSPPFALTDNTGRTVAYVTPTPGMNLRTHLNSTVEVTGSHGFVTGLNTPHIVAESVTRPVE